MANTFTANHDYPATSPNDESDPEEKEPVVKEEEDSKPVKVAANIQELLKKLHSTGAIIPKIKKEQRCVTCNETFANWPELETHLLQHVTLPSVVVDKLQSDDEDAPSGDEPWTDEEDEAPPMPETKTPQKIDVSQLMKNTGITIKSPAIGQNGENPSSALEKLSGLGFTIKKNSTPVKQEKSDQEPQTANDVMQKLGKLGGLKLKIKSDGTNMNSFTVVNGLKDFRTSDDDDDEGSGNEKETQDNGAASDEEQDKGPSEGDPDSADEQTQNDSKDSEEEIQALANTKIVNAINQKIQNEPEEEDTKVAVKQSPSPAKPPGRPSIKQTPKRSDNPIAVRQMQQQVMAKPGVTTPTSISSTPERRSSNNSATTEVTSVKQESETEESPSSNMPLFSGQIKSERTSPEPDSNIISTPIIAKVKTESGELSQTTNAQPLFQNTPSTNIPLMPVTKQEDTGVTIIEINEDDDDDCCVVSTTPASDVKPVIVPKIETSATGSTSFATPTYSTSQPSYGTASSVLGARLGLTTEKQHSFDWNAPDTKAPMDIYKNTDDLFDSLFSSKKESHSLSTASEYISLDTLGPQHSCEVCNTRYTNISLLEEHRRITGHSSSLIAPSSSLMPYGQSSNILSSLLPVKQLAEQVGKLSNINSSTPGFTHQQNVMINIQAYPGSGGIMSAPQGYNAYQQQQPMHAGFHQQPQPNNIYVSPGQAMSGQYPGQTFVTPQGTQVYGQQFQPQMSSAGYAASMPQNTYSTQSPLQGMQQAVYSQSPNMMTSQPGQMGPPLPPGQAHSPYKTSSPVGGNIKIQNVQTFQPGQQPGGPGQVTGNQMPPPGPIRMATGVGKPRMIGVRGARPVMKAGAQMQGQMRGPRPRMPMKRPMNMMGAPAQKRRTDMLLPGKHDNEDCQVMAMQKQREGMPMIHSVQGAKDKLNLPSGISVTKKPVNKAAAMANVLASRGISVKQKQKSRSPSPERPIPHIPNLGAGMSIKHTSKSSTFSIPEAKVGGMHSCRICRKGFANQNSLSMHMVSAHPSSKIPMYKCDECPASYPKSLQLQHHKRTFHNVVGTNRELGLPVVDMSQEENLQKLSNLGIYTFIPLANRDNMDGTFGIPVISVHNMQNGMMSGLQALGADGLLSLGPLKPLPN